MCIPRLLLLSLLISSSAVTAAAQSPAQSPSIEGVSTIGSENGSHPILPLDSRTQRILTLEQNEATCYTLRAYRVARVSPGSDSTRPAGYSTCQRATRFQLKTAVESWELDSREKAPR
jgi:hypothetical protein